MDAWIGRVTEFLNYSPTGSMPLSRLLNRLERQGGSCRESRRGVLHRLVTSRGSFRVVPDRLGPWVDWPHAWASEVRRPRSDPWGDDPWIIPCRPCSSLHGSEEELEKRLRESLQTWGHGMDDGSSQAVGRWVGANVEAERSLRKLLVRTDAGA